jgi:hypothetical protein
MANDKIDGEKVRSRLPPYGSERFNSVRCSPVIGRTPALAAMQRAEPTPRRSPSSASLSPEFRLAVACAMWPPSDYRNEAIRVAAAGVVDWPRFVRLTARHRIFGLVRDGLTRAHPDLPPAIARQITAQAEKRVRQDLAMAAECLRLKNMFGEAGLPILFVKGAPLAIVAFGKLGLRSSQDIDLLVSPDALPAAIALLTGAGYRRYNPPPDIRDDMLRLLMPLRKDFGFAHPSTGIVIELHWRLFLNPHAMVGASIVESSRTVRLSAGAELRTLGDEDLFAYLCTHGAYHCWNRLQWLADINALLTATDRGIEKLISAATARGAGRAADQALLLCSRLFTTSLPATVLRKSENSAIAHWLEATALAAMTSDQGDHEPHDTRFGTTRGSLSTLLLSPSWRYRLAELKVHLTNETDVLSLPLPKRLWFIYPLLRLPFWLWRHAAKRRVRPRGVRSHLGISALRNSRKERF